MPRRESSQSLKIEEWLCDWMLATAGFVPDRDANYIEVDAVDSLRLIELVEDVEGNFNVRFDNRAFWDRRFVTIRGLAEIVHELHQGRHQESPQ